MKFYTRVAFIFLAFALVSPSFSYADDAEEPAEVLSLDEAKSLIDNLPTAHDVVSGPVSTKALGFYDIYGRQISFRESAKELRVSLDVRRENFGAPRVKAIEGYRDTVIKVYAAETAAYQESLNQIEEDEENTAEENGEVMISVGQMDDTEESENVVSVSDDQQGEDVPDLTETPIPSDNNEEGAPKKKVIMSSDAPDFDPANL